MNSQSEPSVKALAEALREGLEGEVHFEASARALYATDASHYRQIPIGIVLPRHVQDVERALAVCRDYQVPVLARGGGTSLAGQGCNAAVVFDFSRYMNRIRSINADKREAVVEPGVVLDDLRKEARKHGLTFGPDPSTHSRCTLGGMIGNDACGVHSIQAGRTIHNVNALEIVTYQGNRWQVAKGNTQSGDPAFQTVQEKLLQLRDRYAAAVRKRFPDIPRRVSGFALDQLLDENGFHLARSLVGTEGTCAIVTEAALRLIPESAGRTLVVMGFGDICLAADAVPEILKYGPIGLEAVDQLMVDNMRIKNFHVDDIARLPQGKGWLFVEFGGDRPEASEARAREMTAAFAKDPGIDVHLHTDPRDQQRVWAVREFGPGATVFVPWKADSWPGWEDSAVAPEKMGAYLRQLLKLFASFDYEGILYGHFGDGCLHTRLNFDFTTDGGVRKYRRFAEAAADLVVGFGGSLSGEHGDGQSRGELLEKMYGRELVQAFEEFKSIWDPRGMMNPGKVVRPHRLDANLRIHPDRAVAKPQTFFQYPDDKGDFTKAVGRCVGIGKCRKKDSGTMCPSYMVTLEEKHSTRGRAHLLYEMMEGEVLKRDWNNPDIKEALDLCLACKACKSECPTNVDMATYKAEFLAHYYQKNRRPLSAHLFGSIDRWARWGSEMPAIANAFLKSGWMKHGVMKWLKIAPQRSLPPLAAESFKHWFFSQPDDDRFKPEVVLFADTFHNYFRPEALKAAVDVLRYAGFRVRVPRETLCCGRPKYDQGMLPQARQKLLRVLRALRRDIRRTVPVVGLEPSCVSVFKDELKSFFPGDPLASRFARQVFLLDEFLAAHAKSVAWPAFEAKALVQGHCHQQALSGTAAAESLLRKTGMDVEIPDAGCCGMAGAFGYEKDHYDVSVRIGERVLLPRVRAADKKTLLVADGFSCREQIRQLTGRHALHFAEVMAQALRQPDREPA